MIRKRIKQLISACVLLLAYVLTHTVYNNFKKKNIWLIAEKPDEARDNGYHLFAYLRQNHHEIPAYYVISKKAPDYKKVSKYGNIIKTNSLKHYSLFLCAKKSISSQPGGASPETYDIAKYLKVLIRKDQHVVFLQHGIIKDELSHSFDYSKTNYSLFICSSEKEKEFVEKTYKYPTGIVKNIGLCRFDNLYKRKSANKKQVLIMPTFRSWLKRIDTTTEATKNELNKFEDSEFYKVYSALLLDKLFLEYLQKAGYIIVFYPHYAMQPYIHSFDNYQSDVVTIADRWHYDVQQLLIESAVLITDYSSVFFDFAYMEKPEIFFQFDEEKYRSTHYKKGYFDYREHGFGPVFETSDQVISYLITLINNNCKLEGKYLDRINAFFDHRDNNNCERTYEAIMEIGK